MFKKILIFCLLATIFAGFLFLAQETVKQKMEFTVVIKEINNLTDKSVEMIGKTPTVESVNSVKEFVKQHSLLVKEKLQTLRDKGRIREKTEDDLVLKETLEINKNKIAAIYNSFVEKARTDIKNLDSLTVQMWKKSKNNLSEKEIKVLEQEADKIEKNNAIIEALESFMSAYETIS